MMKDSGKSCRENMEPCLNVRHCERSEAIQTIIATNGLDCFVAEPVIGPGFARTRWLLAMATPASHFPVHTGLRFSAKAFRPSFASSVMASSAIWLSV
jgi:hypothetical protein